MYCLLLFPVQCYECDFGSGAYAHRGPYGAGAYIDIEAVTAGVISIQAAPFGMHQCSRRPAQQACLHGMCMPREGERYVLVGVAGNVVVPVRRVVGEKYFGVVVVERWIGYVEIAVGGERRLAYILDTDYYNRVIAAVYGAVVVEYEVE